MTYFLIFIVTIGGVPHVILPNNERPSFEQRADCQDFGRYMTRVWSKSYSVPLDDITFRCQSSRT